ncbi:ubiquinol-cytochrome c reductase iron-sulfur subunit [Candidatus Binatia bacterium]|nr:ubiquinol-cytochrome c reductase iron-sulfur subunit [Candidatus Binatia bacterium]
MSEVIQGAGDSVDRREWLARCFWSIITLVGLGLAAPLVGYFLGPLLRRRETLRVRLGAVSDFQANQPQKVEFVLRQRDGWVTEEGRHAAWVVKRSTDDVLVFDPRCTHLGCAYHWQVKENRFLCPCHDGLYDIDGRVIGGPPPRPLDVYPATIEGGELFVVPLAQRRS